VPADVDLLGVVERAVGPPPVIGTARVWVAAGRAHGLRRLGRVLRPSRRAGREGDELEIDLRSVDTVARWVAGYGADVRVLHPPELAAAVRRGWAAVLAAHRGATGTDGDDPDRDGTGPIPVAAAAER
jgi:proteasome accessory factor B